jgi:hypothetical protein
VLDTIQLSFYEWAPVVTDSFVVKIDTPRLWESALRYEISLQCAVNVCGTCKINSTVLESYRAAGPSWLPDSVGEFVALH